MLSNLVINNVEMFAASVPDEIMAGLIQRVVDELRAYRAQAASAGEWTAERIADFRATLMTGGELSSDESLDLLDALAAAQASALQPGEVAADDVRRTSVYERLAWAEHQGMKTTTISAKERGEFLACCGLALPGHEEGNHASEA